MVQPGDIVLFKRSGGSVVGIGEITCAWFYELNDEALATIKKKFGHAMCADNAEFWAKRRSAAFATLLLMDKVFQFDPVRCAKKDRRGWVLLSSGPRK